MISEDDLIARFFAPIAGQGGLGLRDDAALLTIGANEELVVTSDALAAGVHFFAADPPESIARKALRVNLSDLAAKAAEPAGFLLSLALPRDWREEARDDIVFGNHRLSFPRRRESRGNRTIVLDSLSRFARRE